MLVSLGWLGLDLWLRVWYFSSLRAQRHGCCSQNNACWWFKQMFLPGIYNYLSWLPQLGQNKAVSLMAGQVGQYPTLNENTPVFNLSSSVCSQVCYHWFDKTGGNRSRDQALGRYLSCTGSSDPYFSFPPGETVNIAIKSKHFVFWGLCAFYSSLSIKKKKSFEQP